ncbi:hypothetical protein BDB00DRAFT_797991 [Zychaea mexicana]|uniref:uncharacterized protein n=1 Tax=Zychaea mexicana TaxID=64656 RepID=UPI0022FF32CD|nr:uncharacterized protein BDB00DRAFT_797991 [Zychaea mexicana]KAI9499034.1 hypothetical protein BDB00DRAFT_797991 [Zychaea mexicana]
MSTAITIRSHLENGDRVRALEAFEAIAHLPREHGVPRAIAQQLLACLRADIRSEGSSSSGNNNNNSSSSSKNTGSSSNMTTTGTTTTHSYYKAQQLQRRYHRQLELLLTHVQPLGYFWDENEFRVILELFDRMDLVERAEVIFRNRDMYCNQPITMYTYNKLAAAYLRRIKSAVDGRERMRYMDKLSSLIRSASTKHGLKPDVITFNLLLAARARTTPSWKTLEATFQEMEKQGVKPNDRTLNIALDIYGKLDLRGNVEQMLSTILKSLGKSRQSPDVVTYGTTIRNAVLGRDMHTAEKIFKAMVEKGVAPNEYVFAHLVVGYVQLGDMERAHAVIRLMRASPFDLRPTAHVFAPLIQGYAKSFEYDKAYNIFSEMVDQGIPANLTTYTILATMFVDSPIYENPLQAINVLRGLSKLSDAEVLDQAALTVLIEAHGLAGTRDLDASSSSISSSNHDEGDDKTWHRREGSSPSRRDIHAKAAQECYDTIVRHYNKPDHLARTALLTAYARLGLPDKAWEFWQEIKETDTTVTTIHYNALFMGLVGFGRWLPTVKRTFDEMTSQYVRSDGSPIACPDVATYDLLIQGAFMAGDLDWIRALWKLPYRPRLQETDPSPDSARLLVRTYYYALYAMLSAEDASGGREIYQEYKNLPLAPASATIWSHRIHKLALLRFHPLDKPAPL